MKKLILLLSLLAFILTLYFFTPVKNYLTPEGFQQLQIWIEQQGFLAPLIFTILYIVATVISLPGSVITLGGGLLFGAWWGTLINLVAATIGAWMAFLLARYLGGDFVQKRLKGKFKNLDEKIGENGFYTVLYLRLVPLFPFNFLNYGLGLTRISQRDYVLGSLIGMAPGTFVYTSLGSAGRHVSFTDLSTWSDYRVWGPFVLVILLSLIPKLMKKKNKSS